VEKFFFGREHTLGSHLESEEPSRIDRRDHRKICTLRKVQPFYDFGFRDVKFLTSEQTARDFDQFLVSFMVKESLQPSLNSCVVCGEKREQFPISASVYLGGYVCPRCGSGDVELTDVDYESLLKTYRKVGELTENMRAYWLDVLESQLSTKFVSREGLK